MIGQHKFVVRVKISVCEKSISRCNYKCKYSNEKQQIEVFVARNLLDPSFVAKAHDGRSFTAP